MALDENWKKLNKNIEDIHDDKTTPAFLIKPKSDLHHCKLLVSLQRHSAWTAQLETCQRVKWTRTCLLVDTLFTIGTKKANVATWWCQKTLCGTLLHQKRSFQAQAASPRIWCRSLWKWHKYILNYGDYGRFFFYLYVKNSPVNDMGLQQGHCASTKASTRHPASKDTLHFHGCGHQLIQLPAADFIQVSDTEKHSSEQWM